jgi:hypothetical protein
MYGSGNPHSHSLPLPGTLNSANLAGGGIAGEPSRLSPYNPQMMVRGANAHLHAHLHAHSQSGSGGAQQGQRRRSVDEMSGIPDALLLAYHCHTTCILLPYYMHTIVILLVYYCLTTCIPLSYYLQTACVLIVH